MHYVDLNQIHRFDTNTSIEHILRTMNTLIEKGKVLHIGASTMFAWELIKTIWIADKFGLEPLQTMQPHYNPLYRKEE